MKPQLISGIYQIRNSVNGKRYIGSSANIVERFSCHRRELHGQKHPNRYLQAAWNKYGADVFVFEILEECLQDELLTKEQAFIDSLPANLYNLSRKAGSPMAGRKHSDSAREKISAARKIGKNNMLGKTHSAEWRARMSMLATGKPHPHLGWTFSAETRGKLRMQKLGQKNPRYGKAGTMTGRTHSASARKRISEARKGTPWTPARWAALAAKALDV